MVINGVNAHCDTAFFERQKNNSFCCVWLILLSEVEQEFNRTIIPSAVITNIEIC